MTLDTTLASILAAGIVVGIASSQAVPTELAMRQGHQSRPADPEHYPEIVAVTYDAMTGPYFAPRAYAAVAPVIRESVYDSIDRPPMEYSAQALEPEEADLMEFGEVAEPTALHADDTSADVTVQLPIDELHIP